MKRRIQIVLALAMGATLASAAGPRHYNTNTQSLTSTNVQKAISDSAGAFGAYTVCVYNDGATNELYFALRGAAATTSDYMVLAGKSKCVSYNLADGGDGFATVDLKCDTAETTTYDVDAVR